MISSSFENTAALTHEKDNTAASIAEISYFIIFPPKNTKPFYMTTLYRVTSFQHPLIVIITDKYYIFNTNFRA